MNIIDRIIQKSGISDNRGFSLIEILVSTVILIVIVLMMSTIFHQSSISWDTGMRKASGNMMGRGVLGMMARELAGAVDNTNSGFRVFQVSGSTIRFVTLGNTTNNAGQRVSEEVTYEMSGSEIARNGVAVAGNVEGLLFQVPPPSSIPNWTANLPPWINITLAIRRNADVSGVGARSYGPNGVPNTEGTAADDDIRSY
ncbi:MAG: prepilin-type N-terminal cleavage/methylation domain-containing protein [Kiritimatiellae bacterium]|nr:prepilin-type N-terminal cleavage/methylation domain-containing protein [Kiritimatiellia bacterium]MDD5522262.1 prepilin-type N-terminal cleavage/methylation domain-containing protein [Kiritimatiellia bacterium]